MLPKFAIPMKCLRAIGLDWHVPSRERRLREDITVRESTEDEDRELPQPSALDLAIVAWPTEAVPRSAANSSVTLKGSGILVAGGPERTGEGPRELAADPASLNTTISVGGVIVRGDAVVEFR